MSTKLLHQIREQDQAELAARYNGENRRRRSDWVIDVMRTKLPPDQIALANRIMDLQAKAEGIAPTGYESVDGIGNNREGAMAHRVDAQRALNGFDAAVRSRLGANGSRAFWAIAWGHSLAETIRATGYERGSHGMVTKLVQLTMMALQDYDDLCRADSLRNFAIDATTQITP
jgi:hypothetical protein